jgi:prepilin-type N-terminal cleavage/methylation domain-containing protein
MRPQRKEQGFTLIELVVSLTIFSVISLSVYSSFASGISVWRKAQEFSSVYQTARLLLDHMAMELKNAVKVFGTEFNGGPRMISFITLRQTTQGARARRDTRVAKVTFEVRRDPSGRGYALFRRHATNLKRRGEAELMVGSISSLDFQYTYKNSVGELQPWAKVWKMNDELPLGIKITLNIGGTQFTKLVFIPHGFQEEEKI